jgi:hypothetical protein
VTAGVAKGYSPDDSDLVSVGDGLHRCVVIGPSVVIGWYYYARLIEIEY